MKNKTLTLLVLSLIGGLAMIGTANAGIVTGATVDGIETLTICNPSDSRECITIMDRNLGASEVLTCTERYSDYGYGSEFDGYDCEDDEDTYGDYYQRGDNTPHTESDWDSSNIQPSNAWGGSGDNNYNNWGYPVVNSTRQGPCPSGYHVPSMGEWEKLRGWYFYDEEYYTEYNMHYYGSTMFRAAFKIPFAGLRSIDDGSVDGQGDYAQLWSSTPIDRAYHFLVNEEEANVAFSHSRPFGFSVRCFKDTPVAFGESNDENISVSHSEVVSSTVGGIGIVTICDDTGCITIMDKNVGASTIGAGPSAPATSYGNYYKWGINTPYTGGVDSTMNENDQAWNGDKKQGPCPEGYHVPGIGEWANLIKKYAGPNNAGVIKSGNPTLISSFYNAFNIPFAGRLKADNGTVNGLGTYGFLWSSYGDDDYNDEAFGLYVSESSVDGKYHYFRYEDDYDNEFKRRDGAPVRCFKDSSVTFLPSIQYIIPTEEVGFWTINSGRATLGMSQYTAITNIVEDLNGESVFGNLNISFGNDKNTIFTKLAKVTIPVSGISNAIIKVKHGGSNEYNFDGLTTNINASCSSGQVLDPADRYNGESIRVVDGKAIIYTCAASDFVALEGEESPDTAQILVIIDAGTVTIGVDTGASGSLVKNLGEVKVSNSDQILSGDFGENSFWIEDMKGATSGYYTTLSVSDLVGDTTNRVIGKENVQLKPTEVTTISGATASGAHVVFGWSDWTNKTWTGNDSTVTYFNRQNTALADAGRVGKYGDNLWVKVNIPAHTVADTYRGTITYTLYDLDQ